MRAPAEAMEFMLCGRHAGQFKLTRSSRVDHVTDYRGET